MAITHVGYTGMSDPKKLGYLGFVLLFALQRRKKGKNRYSIKAREP
jgi:hypothetical protein